MFSQFICVKSRQQRDFHTFLTCSWLSAATGPAPPPIYESTMNIQGGCIKTGVVRTNYRTFSFRSENLKEYFVFTNNYSVKRHSDIKHCHEQYFHLLICVVHVLITKIFTDIRVCQAPYPSLGIF